MNIKNSVIIVASGNATRMQAVTQDCYPKILTNVGQVTVLDNILTSLKISKDIHLILASELQVKQVKQYLKIVYDDLYDSIITFHITTNSLSSADSIRRHVEVIPNEALIMWSDIWLVEPLESMPKGDTIFCDVEFRHRYNFTSKLNSISASTSGGNICGIYYVTDIQKILRNSLHDDVDFVQYLSHSTYNGVVFDNVNVQIHDVGDESKYKTYLSMQFKKELSTRYFNSLEVTSKNTLRKSAITSKGYDVIQNEINWYVKYHEICKYIQTFVSKMSITSPEITNINRNGGSFEMTYYENCLQLKDVPAYANEAFTAISLLHKLGLIASNNESLLHEYIVVPQQRHDSICSILPNITSVNGLEISKQLGILRRLKIEKYIETVKHFNIIHGDPNSSNIVIHNDVVILIDPRGVFGHTSFYGDANYDFAKFIYGLTGYDNFNQTSDVRFEITNGCIEFDEYVKFEAIEQLVKKYKLDNEVILLVALIWYKLPSYTINNINKAIVAHATSLKLIQLYLNKYDN